MKLVSSIQWKAQRGSEDVPDESLKDSLNDPEILERSCKWLPVYEMPRVLAINVSAKLLVCILVSLNAGL